MNKAEAIKILDANRSPYGEHDNSVELALAEFITDGEISLEGWTHFYSGMDWALRAAIIPAPNQEMFVIATWPDDASDDNESLTEALFCEALHCSPREEYIYKKYCDHIDQDTENGLRQCVENLFSDNGFKIVWEDPDGNEMTDHFNWLLEEIAEDKTTR